MTEENGKAWEGVYLGPSPKKKKRLSAQTRGLKKRLSEGRTMATPEQTAERVREAAELLRKGEWKGLVSVSLLALKWDVSRSRVEQIVAEARRSNRG